MTPIRARCRRFDFKIYKWRLHRSPPQAQKTIMGYIEVVIIRRPAVCVFKIRNEIFGQPTNKKIFNSERPKGMSLEGVERVRPSVGGFTVREKRGFLTFRSEKSF